MTIIRYGFWAQAIHAAQLEQSSMSNGLNVWADLMQMYNVKQTQSEINDLKEKLSIQQQKNQLNELSNEREGQTGSSNVYLVNRGDSEFIHHLTKAVATYTNDILPSLYHRAVAIYQNSSETSWQRPFYTLFTWPGFAFVQAWMISFQTLSANAPLNYFLFQFDDFRPRSFTEPFEHTEGLKDILPRHLRKPFRLLNEVNSNKDLPDLVKP